jgi:hypothetical protein
MLDKNKAWRSVLDKKIIRLVSNINAQYLSITPVYKNLHN